MNEKKPLFLFCDCYTEGISIDPTYEDGSFCFSYWNYGFGSTKGAHWKEKLRYCWRVITKGKPYEDMVILNKDKIKELIDYLTPLVKEPNEKKPTENI